MTALTLVQAEDTAEIVGRELFLDPRVEAETLETYVDNFDVTLTGTATTYAAKMFAEDAVRRVRGIHEVRNHISVTIPPAPFRADIEIANAVRHMLSWNALLPALSLNCVVSDGWVLITGKVLAEYQKEEAETAISHLAGVKGILNDIVVEA